LENKTLNYSKCTN